MAVAGCVFDDSAGDGLGGGGGDGGGNNHGDSGDGCGDDGARSMYWYWCRMMKIAAGH